MRVYEVRSEPGIDALALAEREVLRPGPGQALLRMRAASLNYRDLLLVKGAYGRRDGAPLVPLSDGVGEVVEVGEGVTRVKIGERVAGNFMQNWLSGGLTPAASESALGGALDGVLAEYVALDESGLVRVPEHLSDEEAATLPCAGVTAWNALIAEGGLKAGDTILVQGTGGVSLFALQFARLHGARVIVTSGSDEKLGRALRMGASDGINYRRVPEWDEQAVSLTRGRGVDHVVEVGGAGTLTRSLRAVRVGGRISLIGVLTGAAGEIATAMIHRKYLRVQGILVGSREVFETMNRAIGLHGLKPVVDRVFSFDEARAAFRYMESGAHFGKISIRF